MRDPRKSAVAQAAMSAFAPLGDLFIKLGVSCPEAESLLRSAMVHGAFERERAGGEESVNLSRIALLTGVHRNEVKRILSAAPGIDPGREARRHRGNRILAAWHTDPDYTSPDGTPRELDLKNTRRRGVSFWGLVKRYAPGVWPKMILDELLRVGAVEHVSEQRLKVLMQAYGVAGFDADAIEDLGNRAKDLLETLVYNLLHPSASRVCETVLSIDADPKFLPLLRNSIQRRTQPYLSGLVEELNNPRTSRSSRSESSTRIGVTVYSFESASAEGPVHEQKEGKRKK